MTERAPQRRRRWCAFAFGALLSVSCVRHEDAPKAAKGEGCACRGHAAAVDAAHLCGAWKDSVVLDEARSHVTFPELDPRSCFVRVRYAEDGTLKADATPAACAFPAEGDAAVRATQIARYESIANGDSKSLPFDLACKLPVAERTLAARVNATTLRAVGGSAIDTQSEPKYPYAAIATFGYGARVQIESGLSAWRPGDACKALTPAQMQALGPNVVRAGHAAAAYHAHVAPVVIVSGGAVHSPLYEAYLLDYLLTCKFGVPADAVLLDPCADHTHTNVRNTGGLVVALGGRTAYVVTDGLQAGYLQEWTLFDLIGGSIDQRSLRDFGYLLGSFRQASVGTRYGFWLTPYRFWAEPKDGLGGLTCDR